MALKILLLLSSVEAKSVHESSNLQQPSGPKRGRNPLINAIIKNLIITF